MYPKSIEQLISSFSKFPGVGRRASERFVFHLLKSGKKDVAELTLALKELIEQVKSCETCWDFSQDSPCATCTSEKRNQSIICVVQEPQDVRAIEQISSYTGVFHVLRGMIKPSFRAQKAGVIKIDELFARIKKAKEVSEIILALNPTLEGETTMMYIEQYLKKNHPAITVTRLARGIPVGSDIEYADELTLTSAITNRTKM